MPYLWRECRTRNGIASTLSDLPLEMRGLLPRLEVVVEHELPGVRAQADLVDLLGPLVVEPGVDQVVGEDAALDEEVVIGLQGVQDRLSDAGAAASVLASDGDIVLGTHGGSPELDVPLSPRARLPPEVGW
ncbi:MAG: hypothetical protein V7646_7318, partial [Pseudonocardia sp.]